MRRIVKQLLLLLLIFFSVSSYGFDEQLVGDAKNLVAYFCEGEFSGSLAGAEYRDLLIKYTPSRLEKFRVERGDEYPFVVYIESDPLFIVDQYKIVDIKQTDSTHAYATVNYHQLASTTGFGDDISSPDSRKFIKDVRDITIKLNLEYDGKRWWIIDPPYPKISYDVMIKYYEEQVSLRHSYLTGGRPKDLKPLTPEEKIDLQNAYNYEKSILDFLLGLKK